MHELENIEVLCPAQIENVEYLDDRAILVLKDHTPLTANLIVGADGSRSWIRQQADIAVKGWDFDQAALVTTVKTEKYHLDTAWQRFLNKAHFFKCISMINVIFI